MSTTPRRHRAARRRILAALLAGVATVGAAAAGLGGLVADQLGADTGSVGACDDDGIELDFRTTFDATRREYMVDRVYLTGIDPDCRGLSYKFSIFERGTNRRAFIERDSFDFGLYDADPTLLGFELAGRITYAASFPAEYLTGVAITIGGRQIDL